MRAAGSEFSGVSARTRQSVGLKLDTDEGLIPIEERAAHPFQILSEAPTLDSGDGGETNRVT